MSGTKSMRALGDSGVLPVPQVLVEADANGRSEKTHGRRWLTLKRFLAATIALSALLLVGGPAAAKGPPDIVSFEDEVVAVNPCTGEVHTLFLSLSLRIHEFNNEAGDRHHFNIHESIDIETSDGFSGTLVGAVIDNGAGLFGSEETTGMFAAAENAVLSNPATGQRIRFQFHDHLTLVDMELIVDNFTLVLECMAANGA